MRDKIIKAIVVMMKMTALRFFGSTNILESRINNRRLARGRIMIKCPAVVQNQTKASFAIILKPGEVDVSRMNFIYPLSAIEKYLI